MNVRDLKYLVTLADTKHFGRAAEACFVSQPTLSTQLKKLEEELEVQLIERAPRNVMLTEVGEDVVDRARLVLRDIEQIYEVARRTKDPEAGTIRLGIFPTLGPYLLPHVIEGLQERYPRLELLLIEEKSDDLLDMLRAGRVDAVLIALPLDEEAFVVEPLFEEPFVLAAPRGHALAEGAEHVDISALGHHTVLLLEDGHCLREQALDVCHLASANEKVGFRATSLETLRQMVASGVGITLLPLLAVEPPVPENRSLAIRRFSDPAPRRRIGMAWRRSSGVGGFLHDFAGELKALAEAAVATHNDGSPS